MNLIISEHKENSPTPTDLKRNFPTICLNMIVKNESHIIVDTLQHLYNYFKFDYWVISDTGSTDSTKKLIKEFFEIFNIPGELIEHEWVDFGHNRSKALEVAYNKTDYLLIFDADDKIIGNLIIPETLTSDKYMLKFGKGFEYMRPLLINNRKKWCFKGVLHEFLSSNDLRVTEDKIIGDYYIESGRHGNRNKNPNKYYDDAIVLEKGFNKEILPGGDRGMASRYAFYCGQSFKDAGPNYVDKAIEWYSKVLELDNWLQEKYYSCCQLGQLYKSKLDMITAVKYWLKSMDYDKERIEGVVSACEYYYNTGIHFLVNSLYERFKHYNKHLQGKLFINQYQYKDELEYYNSISAYYANNHESGYEACKRILINNSLPFDRIKLTIKNIMFYKELIHKELIHKELTNNNNQCLFFYAVDNIICELSKKNETIEQHHIELWNMLFEGVRHTLTNVDKNLYNNKKLSTKNNEIIITFTTCKRYDLFKQTINSIMNHWTDIDKIDVWFCVDDNSSEEDRTNMLNNYPWMNYYMKTPAEKGHRTSMNIIWNKLNELKPKYWIHIEDDFLFHHKMDYITTAIDALNDNVKQILFNRNYGETISNYNTKGHLQIDNKSDKSNNLIVLHDHKNGSFPYSNSHYWPHYSFRPSLIDVNTILNLGNYDSSNQFFERDYADKWYKAGYKSAFLNRITNRHIGRLTSEISNSQIKNAYQLNEEEQFVNNNTEKNIVYGSIDTTKEVKNREKRTIKIINLERRPDRKEKTIETLTHAGFDTTSYEFIKAVDGNIIELTIELKKLFDGNDFGYKKGVIGCALSHYNLWQQLLNDNNYDYYIIMEDDITLVDNFKEIIESDILVKAMIKKDVLFLGYHMFEKEREIVKHIYSDINNQVDDIQIDNLNKKLYIGGYFSYSINKIGAKKLIDYIKINGIKHGIDYLNKISIEVSSYETQPQLSFSIWNENNKSIDSDIQFNYKKFDFTKIVENKIPIEEHFIFIPNLDQDGNDIYYNKKPVKECMEISLNDNNCVGFNTLCFFKNKLDKLTTSCYFGNKDGIYIKKQYYELWKNNIMNYEKIIRIKMLCNWCSSEQLCREWSNMCDDIQSTIFKWKNIQITWVDTNIDYYVIINSPPLNTYYNPSKTIVFQMEPWVYDTNKNWGVKTWGKWAEPNLNNFLAVRGRKSLCHNNAFWQLELNYNQLKNLTYGSKKDSVSSICSSKYFDPGHIARIDFLKYIEKKGDIKLDIYNSNNNHEFKNYRGPLTAYVDKSKGIINHKYYFMVENNYEENFITEKLWEPILCETLVFYYGCPNVNDYINSLAYVLLDMNDFEKSYNIMKTAIKEDWWSQRIDIIRKEKEKILNELAFFPVIEKIITNDE